MNTNLNFFVKTLISYVPYGKEIYYAYSREHFREDLYDNEQDYDLEKGTVDQDYQNYQEYPEEYEYNQQPNTGCYGTMMAPFVVSEY